MLDAARRGDQEAFRTLHRQHLRHVRALARRVLHTHDVEDVCQEVFLRAFTRLESFAGESSFRTWVSRIALYECLRVLRRFRQASNGGIHLVPLESVPPHAFLVCGNPQLEVSDLFEGLSPLQRQLLEMAYVEEMPAAEIAGALGTTVGQVKSALHRAKQRARKNK